MIIKDKNIPRKNKITEDRLDFYSEKNPLMSVVEISNSGMCNRKCSFCPRSDPDYPDVNEFISNDLHTKIFQNFHLNYKGSDLFWLCRTSLHKKFMKIYLKLEKSYQTRKLKL